LGEWTFSGGQKYLFRRRTQVFWVWNEFKKKKTNMLKQFKTSLLCNVGAWTTGEKLNMDNR